MSDVIDYFKAKAPNEAGGYIDAQGVFHPLDNIADNPSSHFHFASVPDDAIKLVHSHPNGPFAPSEMDQRQQIAMAVPWQIVAWQGDRTEVFEFGDEAPIPPLIGRGFRHYVTDCYAACRDMYRTKCDVLLPHFPREWEWWRHDKRLLSEGFAEAGFHAIEHRDILPGDAMLMCVRADTPNHSAVYMGDGWIYHHMSGRTESAPDRVACMDYLGRWQPYVTTVLRHEDNRITRTPWQAIRQELQATSARRD